MPSYKTSAPKEQAGCG